jgi:hypothetical protein
MSSTKDKAAENKAISRSQRSLDNRQKKRWQNEGISWNVGENE